ncbi:hypothetical protein O1611_g2355 [Lasiodiplodia mahajangana]|uniref:Uncharacterized protein n=1 Tax=Lasiodiplodia mahajangana TaxID=1108764 RepID=A0ACC2JVD4_9PEZI|nr:hypothetical protein O1611_g2355 [Lasiodiplodia mahajangana]
MHSTFNEATLIKSEDNRNDALGENGDQTKPKMLEEVEQARSATASVSNMQTTEGTTETVAPIGNRLDRFRNRKLEDPEEKVTKAQSGEPESTKATPARTPQTITVKHHNGEPFLLPWALCQTQKGMEEQCLISTIALNPEKWQKTLKRPIRQKSNTQSHITREEDLGNGARELRTEAPDVPKLNVGDMPGWTSLQVHSPLLLNALKSMVKYVSIETHGSKSDSLKEGKFMYPYKDLFHHKQELSDYKKSTTGPRTNHTAEYNAECDRHIDFLLEFLEKEPSVRLSLVEANWAKKTPTTTFGAFWLLMKPGSDVYVKEDGQLNAYVIESVYGGVDYLSKFDWSISTEAYSISVWNLVFDGKVIRRESKDIRVPIFDNEKDILSLPLFPTRFQDKIDGGARRKQLIERGRKMFRFSKGPTYLEYSGSGLKPGWKKYNQARVIVVHEPSSGDEWHSNQRDDSSDDSEDEDDIGQRARAPRCECTACRDIDATAEKYISETFSDYDGIDPKDTNELSEHQYLICMSHMSGFILKDRNYDLLDVSHLADVNIVKDAIDRLVMRPETNKDTIKAIVKTYTEGSQTGHFNADFIRGKGEGQIFLLHGPPGTGKTLTAESVAEYTRRPLLSITAADLGHEPIKLEENLLRFFKDATEWDAIVLLDEADVYLERRSAHDLRRNSIVSIFLRAMDYFQGILFLTSNRVGHFDEAFMSRIHVSIGYERLDEDARSKIWDNLFSKLKEDHKNGGLEIRYEYDAKQYVKKDPEIKRLQWNGREIRNAFQTAVALAVFDAKLAKERGASDEDTIPEIKEKHLSQVVSMSSAFKEYITATHEGIEDADMAYKLGIRHDKLGAL